MVLARERQVIDFSGEGKIPGSETDQLSCKIYDLAGAKAVIVAFSPTGGERERAATSRKNRTILSPSSKPRAIIIAVV